VAVRSPYRLAKVEHLVLGASGQGAVEARLVGAGGTAVRSSLAQAGKSQSVVNGFPVRFRGSRRNGASRRLIG